MSGTRGIVAAPPVYLVSSCLLGLATRYDGASKPMAAVHKILNGSFWLPVCPEQLGGLATPRPPAELVDGDGYAVLEGRGRVLDRQGRDVTAQFTRGAEMVLKIAAMHPVTGCLLKSRSPSCGCGEIVGVTAALLVRHGYWVREF